MRSSYRRLGDYIRLVDERNRNLEVTNLVGLTINKNFIPSVANVVNTDMSTYKIIRENQFACSVMQVRRDKKMPVALWKSKNSAIISQAYPIFEIVDENLVSPDYLMMWFTRNEFDREACFLAVGGVRGSLEWEDFLNMEFPLPTLEKQKEIVAEYEAVEQRIQLNKKLCEKLEETAQTLYRHWFEDFEFPVDSHCEERGMSDEAFLSLGYKSSGGEMVECEELGKEIPKGFQVFKIDELVEKSLGGDWGKENAEGNYEQKVLCVRGADVNNLKYGNYNNAPIRFILKKNIVSRNLEKDNIVIELSGGSPTQSTGRAVQISENLLKHVGEKMICSNFCRALKIKEGYSDLVFSKINYEYKLDTFFRYENSSNGVKNLNIGDLFSDLKIVTNDKLYLEYNKIYKVIKDKLLSLGIQTQKLEELKNLLLGKMAVEK